MKKKIIIASASGMATILVIVFGLKRHQIRSWIEEKYDDLKIFLKLEDWDE